MGGRWQRWAPVSGVLFAALSAVALGIASQEIGDSSAKVVAFYEDAGNRAREIAAFFLVVVAVLFFLWFLSVLRERLRSVEKESQSLSSLAFGGGVAHAALLVASVGVFVAHSFTVEIRDEFQVDANAAWLLEGAGIILFAGALMVASVLVAATSVLAIKTAVLPTWVGWVGAVVAVVLLAGIVFFPIFVLLAWVLLVSVVLIVRAPSQQLTEQEAPGAT